MVTADFRVNKLGSITPKSCLKKKRSKSTDDVVAVLTDEESS